MKKIQLLLLLLSSLSCFAQDLVLIDTIKLKCSYDYQYLLDTTSTSNKKYSSADILHLQIGSKYSKCFSYRTYQVDSINAYGDLSEFINNKILEAESKGKSYKEAFKTTVPRYGMTAKVYKNYPEGKTTITESIVLDYYQYEDDLNLQNWDLQGDSIRSILGYSCQKATCTFRGREWTAWFALDIPISDGPWKFSGLPGLIMEAYDKGYQHWFRINGLQQVQNEPLYFGTDGKDISTFQKVKRTDLLKLQLDYFKDPYHYSEMSTGISLGQGPRFERKRDLLERE